MKFYNLILDRSGSMSNIWNNIVESVDEHIEKKVSGSLCSLLLFDTEGLDFAYKYSGSPEKIDKSKYRPRGGTPLRDAIMCSIETLVTDWGDFLWQDFVEVEFTIFTDSEENSSKHWKLEDVNRTLQHFQNEYGWKFNFIGCSDSIEVSKYAATLGFKTENSISYSSNESIKKAFASIK